MRNFLVAICIAVPTLLAVTACSVTSKQSTVGEYVDDSTTTGRVQAGLLKDNSVSAVRINVETLKGVVMLSGFAVSEAEKKRASEIASSVPHVKEVRNSIVVQPAK